MRSGLRAHRAPPSASRSRCSSSSAVRTSRIRARRHSLAPTAAADAKSGRRRLAAPRPRRARAPGAAAARLRRLDARRPAPRDLARCSASACWSSSSTRRSPSTRAGRDARGHAIAKLRGEHNFEIVGVAIGVEPRRRRARSSRASGSTFRVIDDSSRRDRAALRPAHVRSRCSASTPRATSSSAWRSFPSDGGHADARRAAAARGAAPARARATSAASATPDGADLRRQACSTARSPSTSRQQRGQPVVLIFFLHTCPHCHDFLEFMKERARDAARGQAAGARRRRADGPHDGGARAAARSDGLDFFPVVFDDDGKIRTAYGVFGGVPDVVLIDAAGPHRVAPSGLARRARDAPLLRMRLARLAGAPVPMLLRKEGYSGNEACGVCHEAQHDDLAAHRRTPRAFDTLVRHGADAQRRVRRAATWSASASRAATRSRKRQPRARGRRLRGLPRPRRPAPLAGLREGRRLLRTPASPATTRSTRSASTTRPSCRASRTRRTRRSLALPAAERQKRARRARRARAATCCRRAAALRRLGGLPELPRRGARDLVAEPPRARDRDAGEEGNARATRTACAATPPATVARAASRRAARRRTHPGPRARRLRVVPRTGRRPRRRRTRRSAARSSRSATSATPA